jgi:hypothetical protein
MNSFGLPFVSDSLEVLRGRDWKGFGMLGEEKEAVPG